MNGFYNCGCKLPLYIAPYLTIIFAFIDHSRVKRKDFSTEFSLATFSLYNHIPRSVEKGHLQLVLLQLLSHHALYIDTYVTDTLEFLSNVGLRIYSYNDIVVCVECQLP